MNDSGALRIAALFGIIEVLEQLLQDKRVDPAAENNYAIRVAAREGHLAVVEWLLQDERVDPTADDNFAVRSAAEWGYLDVVDRLLRDKRVDPAAYNNDAVRWAARRGHFAVVDRLLEDSRVDLAMAIQHSLPKDRKRFEYRERFTEICIALQGLNLPAWVTVKILKACKPWSTLKLHQKWKLACTVKHFTKDPVRQPI